MASSPVPTTPGALASVASFIQRFPQVGGSLEPDVIAELLVEATAQIEDITSRRLAPFTSILYEDGLWGLSPDEYGDASIGMPISMAGSLGTSFANALGANDLVRHFWLPEYAPTYSELWTYTLESINIFLTYGNTQPIDINASSGSIIGPEVNSGHVWLRLGTFSPVGTRIKVVYSGGYTGGIPPSLSRACLFQALKFAMLEAEPQVRSKMDYNEINLMINQLVAPWVRG